MLLSKISEHLHVSSLHDCLPCCFILIVEKQLLVELGSWTSQAEWHYIWVVVVGLKMLSILQGIPSDQVGEEHIYTMLYRCNIISVNISFNQFIAIHQTNPEIQTKNMFITCILFTWHAGSDKTPSYDDSSCLIIIIPLRFIL